MKESALKFEHAESRQDPVHTDTEVSTSYNWISEHTTGT